MAKIDFKQAALDHVEKVVFGIIVLVVLMGLWGTQWKPYAGTPRQIEDAVNTGRKTLLTNKWPEEEQQQFTVTGAAVPRNIVHERLWSSINPADYELSTKLVADVLGGNEPIREPDRNAPQDPIATAGRAYLQQVDPASLEIDPTALAASSTPVMQEIDSGVAGEFRRKANQVRNLPTEGMEGEIFRYGSLQSQIETSQYTNTRRRGRTASAAGQPGMPPGAAGMGGPGMGPYDPNNPYGAGPVPLIGKGYHFVSVRAIFPLRDQIRKFADAIHRPFSEAAALFDIRDFELERQMALPGDNPWTGPWEPVDMDVVADILQRSDGFEADVVSSAVTNSVVTMPLPMRLTGVWDADVASHPRIQKFVLSEEEIEFELKMQREMLDELVKQNREIDAATVKRKGFNEFQFDSRSVRADLMGTQTYGFGGMGGMGGGMGGYGMGDEEMGMGYSSGSGQFAPSTISVGPNANVTGQQQALITALAKKLSTDKKADIKKEEEKIKKWLMTSMSAEGELLLFRFLDFSVEPGKTYRYRVRLVLANPNFNRRPADAGGLAHVVEGETRETPWSKETEPVRIEEDVRYFLTSVEDRVGRVLPIARMDVFEWDPKYGTTMNHALDIRTGQRIGDKVNTTVIDPANFFYGEREYVFNSQDYLVDVQTDIQFESDLHEKADDGKRFKPTGLRGRVECTPAGLVNKSGTLKQLTDGRRDALYARLKKEQEWISTQFEYLKEPVAEEMAVDEFGNPVDVDGNPIKEGRKNRSALRKKTPIGAANRPPL
ncbi:hypothetical protein [Planctomicrobium sp. SH664]|uniref:hypothetical protein n=1 Tax=Planctomicrobium sp. SH664 TaxID=3448125 RepID=UPI003F5C6ED9